MSGSIDEIWDRITAHQGRSFRTVTGKEFTYESAGTVLRIIRDGKEINQDISMGNFEKALPHMPTEGPGVLSDMIRGSAYVWAILMDHRIRSGY